MARVLAITTVLAAALLGVLTCTAGPPVDHENAPPGGVVPNPASNADQVRAAANEAFTRELPTTPPVAQTAPAQRDPAGAPKRIQAAFHRALEHASLGSYDAAARALLAHDLDRDIAAVEGDPRPYITARVALLEALGALRELPD